jgi:hypothetical protein
MLKIALRNVRLARRVIPRSLIPRIELANRKVVGHTTTIEGFNLRSAVTTEDNSGFADLVVPELQRRGVYKTDYTPRTLR